MLAVVDCFRLPSSGVFPAPLVFRKSFILHSHVGDFVQITTRRPRVEIEYCSKCKWMLRSAYLAQELLSTFEMVLKEVTLVPNHEVAGTFLVRLDDSIIWDRKIENGFPDAKHLKQRVRDIVDPTRSLGHSDVKVVEVKE